VRHTIPLNATNTRGQNQEGGGGNPIKKFTNKALSLIRQTKDKQCNKTIDIRG
jgi:hypothetical protein